MVTVTETHREGGEASTPQVIRQPFERHRRWPGTGFDGCWEILFYPSPTLFLCSPHHFFCGQSVGVVPGNKPPQLFTTGSQQHQARSGYLSAVGGICESEWLDYSGSVRVGDERKRKIKFDHHGSVLSGGIDRKPVKPHAGSDEPGMDSSQADQLTVAVRSPITPQEHEQRSRIEMIGQRPRFPGLIQ